MKLRPKSLAIAVVSVVVVSFALLYVLQLATSEQVRSRLEALLEERTGLAVIIQGGVDWQYLWPTAVELHDIRASNASGSEQWLADSLRLQLDTLSILQAPRSPQNWQVSGIQILKLRGNRSSSSVGRQQVDQYAIDVFEIQNLKLGETAPFSAVLSYNELGTEPANLEMSGNLRLIASERKLHFEPANISGNVATGRCDADIALRQISEAATVTPASTAHTLLNTDLWRRSDWDLRCELTTLSLNGSTFNNVSLTSSNLLGSSQSQLTLPVFFSGSAELNLAIDASPSLGDTAQSVPRWAITPTITNVASGDFLNWLQDRGEHSDAAQQWQGPVTIAGRVETTGNHRAALLSAAQGELTLTSNNGTLDLTRFKANMAGPLDELRSLIGDAQTLRDWPDTLEYLTLEGRWSPTDGYQRITGRLDNLVVDATAMVNAHPVTASGDTLSANGTVTFSTTQLPLSLPVPPLLEDLPLPLTCNGPPSAPQCSLDTKASKKLLAAVLRGEGPAGLSRKIDAMIDDKVPEKYRRAARSLLEILGHSVEDKDADEMEDFLGEDFEEAPEEREQQ